MNFFFLKVLVVTAAGMAALASPATAAEKFLPDLEFRAKVRAKEMVFETVTGAHVDFHGTPDRETEWKVRRKNLPKPVKPGEVYRDVEVDATATSTFRDISSAVLPRHRER